MSKKTVKQLFEGFKPLSYDISLKLDKKNTCFSGVVRILGEKAGKPSKRLTFHQKGLEIAQASVVQNTKQGKRIVKIVRINSHKTFDEIRIHSQDTLYPGLYEIELLFSGKITTMMHGIYPCNFKIGSKKEVLIATQFESHHAREVFPCIDEPEAKAKFDLTITSPAENTVISNTPIKKQISKNGNSITKFETTPVMSTYLLAFVCGKLEYIESKTKQDILVRAYATPNNIKHAEFAIDVAVRCLEFYDNYFDIPYPLSKCDIIALPDFASGAMENWGCITFREQCMLVDKHHTSLQAKQYVAMVVAHELAHQWFGNLVTMRWWTDLWLNEGFASWIEYLAIDKLFPEWNMWTQFVADEQQTALKLDALENTHPIEVPVSHPEEIHSIFDTISYSKGSSVINMLHEYLGPEDFRDGLRYYLKKHAYGNTNTIDLWNSLAHVAKKPVQEFMSYWTKQAGYPIVKIDKNNHIISQEKFLINRSNIKNQSEFLWPIPLLSDNKELPKLLNKNHIDFKNNTTNIMLNKNQSGFYRTIYSSEFIKQLPDLLNSESLPPQNRLGILSDLFESAKAGYSKTTIALSYTASQKNEKNAAVWDIIASNIVETRSVMGEDEFRDAMNPFIQELIKPQLERLGWKTQENETYFDSLLRPTILGLATISEDPKILKECKRIFDNSESPEEIDSNLRGIICNSVAKQGQDEIFEKLLAWHNKSTNSETRTTLAAAITSFKQTKLINKSLSVIRTKDVRLQDVAYWVAYSFANRKAKKITWNWMVEHWEWLAENIGKDLSFYRFPIYAARSFNDAKFLKEYCEFFDSVSTPALERSIKQGVEIIQWHADWKKRDYSDTLKYLKSR